MAIVRKLEKIILDKDHKHTEVDATYSIVENEGQKYLQIDTYGSENRKIQGKKSQSIRFSFEAIEQLKAIIDNEL
mgnify:CR=1 FL=1